MVLALRNIGYDAFVLGNHEFNYSWEVMQSMYGQLKAEDDENGSSVDVLGANLYWRDGDNAGQNAFTPYITKTFQVDGQEFKVGIIGFENTDCDQFDVPANFGVGEDGTGGVTLTPPGNPTRDMALEAEKYVTQLRKPEAEGGEGCDFVIIAYHSGMGSGNTEGDLVIGTNTESQSARMEPQRRDQPQRAPRKDGGDGFHIRPQGKEKDGDEEKGPAGDPQGDGRHVDDEDPHQHAAGHDELVAAGFLKNGHRSLPSAPAAPPCAEAGAAHCFVYLYYKYATRIPRQAGGVNGAAAISHRGPCTLHARPKCGILLRTHSFTRQEVRLL